MTPDTLTSLNTRRRARAQNVALVVAIIILAVVVLAIDPAAGRGL